MTSPELLRLQVAVLLFLISGVNGLLKYDFIVVGAGAGGCAVARRLVENGGFKVLLLEAGGMPKLHFDVPAFAPQILEDPDVTFQFESIRQSQAALRNNGIVSIVAGRSLGGTTALNYMWFNRGHPFDWNNWAVATGDESWGYEYMLKYFKRLETYQGVFPSEQHGIDGPITVSRPSYSPGLEFWLAAAAELGYPVGDPNGPQQRSFSPVEFNKRRGRRVSAFEGYITPILNNPNLQIATNTNVTEILFNGNRAVGVRFFFNAANSSSTAAPEDVVYAEKEVIISAGSYNSPLILQRSGIGPRSVLHAAKIPVIKELPTGLNFQDHPQINLNLIINTDAVVMDEQRDLTAENWKLFNSMGDGPYSSIRGATGQAMMSTSVAAAEGNFDWPDMQLCMSHSTTPYVAVEGLDETAYRNLKPGESPMSLAVFMGRPKSRGSVSINSSNPLGSPVLDVGYLTDPRDLQMYLDTIQETLRIYEQTKSYSRLQARYAPVMLPACQQFPERSREYWECYVRQIIQGGTHPAGTNKMGRVDDPTAVVDSELRVIGMEGLRVVDASIMPFIVNANPQCAVYAIAEKAADMILNQWGSNSVTIAESSVHEITVIPVPTVVGSLVDMIKDFIFNVP